MNVSLATDCHLQIVDILRRKTATHVILKTVACLTYGRLVQNKGPIVVLLQKILQLNNVAEMLSDISFCRIGVLINTSMDEEFDKNDEKGLQTLYSIYGNSFYLKYLLVLNVTWIR